MEPESDLKFNDLPVMIKSMIFSFLPLVDKISVRLVCKDWLEAIDKYQRFLKYHAYMNNYNFQYVLATNVVIDKLHVSNLTVFLPKSVSNLTLKVKTLTFDVRTTEDSNGFIKFRTANATNMEKLLKSCTNIEMLKFGQLSLLDLSKCRFLQDIKLNMLHTLKVKLYGSYVASQQFAIINLLKCTFPRLVTLELDYSSLIVYPWKQYGEIYVSTFNFIGRHHETLKELTLEHGHCDLNTYGLLPTWNELLSEEAANPLKKVSLNSLKLALLSNKQIFEKLEFDLDFILATSQAALSDFRLSGSVIPTEYQEVLKINKPTLKHITFKNDDGIFDLDLSVLQNAPKLQYLHISGCKAANLELLPKSIEYLTWSDVLTTEQFLWIIYNMSNLEKLVLIGMKLSIQQISVAMFGQLIHSLSKLKYLHLDCIKDKGGICEYVKKLQTEGWKISVKYGEKIYICQRPSKSNS